MSKSRAAARATRSTVAASSRCNRSASTFPTRTTSGSAAFRVAPADHRVHAERQLARLGGRSVEAARDERHLRQDRPKVAAYMQYRRCAAVAQGAEDADERGRGEPLEVLSAEHLAGRRRLGHGDAVRSGGVLREREPDHDRLQGRDEFFGGGRVAPREAQEEAGIHDHRRERDRAEHAAEDRDSRAQTLFSRSIASSTTGARPERSGSNSGRPPAPAGKPARAGSVRHSTATCGSTVALPMSTVQPSASASTVMQNGTARHSRPVSSRVARTISAIARASECAAGQARPTRRMAEAVAMVIMPPGQMTGGRSTGSRRSARRSRSRGVWDIMGLMGMMGNMGACSRRITAFSRIPARRPSWRLCSPAGWRWGLRSRCRG